MSGPCFNFHVLRAAEEPTDLEQLEEETRSEAVEEILDADGEAKNTEPEYLRWRAAQVLDYYARLGGARRWSEGAPPFQQDLPLRAYVAKTRQWLQTALLEDSNPASEGVLDLLAEEMLQWLSAAHWREDTTGQEEAERRRIRQKRPALPHEPQHIRAEAAICEDDQIERALAEMERVSAGRVEKKATPQKKPAAQGGRPCHGRGRGWPCISANARTARQLQEQQQGRRQQMHLLQRRPHGQSLQLAQRPERSPWQPEEVPCGLRGQASRLQLRPAPRARQLPRRAAHEGGGRCPATGRSPARPEGAAQSPSRSATRQSLLVSDAGAAQARLARTHRGGAQEVQAPSQGRPQSRPEEVLQGQRHRSAPGRGRRRQRRGLASAGPL